MSSFKGSLKRIKVLSNLVLIIVTIVLAVFCSLLGNKVLDDVDAWFVPPTRAAFDSHQELAQIGEQHKVLAKQEGAIEEEQRLARKSQQVVRRKYNNERESYRLWVSTRRALRSSKHDAAVVARTKALDQLRALVEEWEGKLEQMDEGLRQLALQRVQLDRQRGDLEAADDASYHQAHKIYTVKVFFIRLALVLPILLLAVFLFVRFRRSKYWPLVWGYVLFALYAFFVGLLPYLPSFGGYVRYTVGIVLSALAGAYVIHQLTGYIKRKREELDQARSARALNIQQETSIKAHRSHCCPSCERDFLFTGWGPLSGVGGRVVDEAQAPDHCSHCGLRLFTACPSCQERGFAHFRHCKACGSSLSES